MYRIVFSLDADDMPAVLEDRHPGLPGYPPDSIRNAAVSILADTKRNFGPAAGLVRLDFQDDGSVPALSTGEGRELV